MLGNVIALLAAHLACGTLLIAGMMSFSHRVPTGFQRFCASLAAIGGLMALALGSTDDRMSWSVATVAAVTWAIWLHRRSETPRVLAGLCAAAGLGSIFWFGFLAAERAGISPLASIGAATSSMLLLGTVTVTMILGHWYLVDVHLSIAPLRQGAWWLWVAVASRWFTVGLVLAIGGWETLRIGRAADIIYSTSALFFVFRALVGLGAPLLLAGLIWQTVRIRSTQSATGLLYVALMLVLFGELVAHFLQFTTGLPL